MGILRALPVPLGNPIRILDALEAALSGTDHWLPVPEQDPARAQLLRSTQREGDEIDSDIALVMCTSGSTGTPKGAQLTVANLVASARATEERLGGPGQWLLAMPAHYIAGLQVLVRSVIADTNPRYVDLSQGFNVPEFVEQSASLSSARRYTSLTPMQLIKAMRTLAGIDALRLYDAVLIGGAPLPAEELRAARQLRINVVTTYGSSETSGGCVYNGKALPGARVRLDAQRIVLGGPMIAHGYRNAPSDEAFREPGWFRTSDTGFIEDDLLTVTGRLDTIIDTGGLKVHPEVIEQEILRVPGVQAVCVVGIPHPRYGQAIAAAYQGSATIPEIMDGLHSLSRWQLPKDLRQVETLPLTHSGKVDRHAVQEIFQNP